MTTPTPEQDAAVGLFASGMTFAVEAGAGTGKTTTLEQMARTTERPGTYVAFNLSIVTEAGSRMPLNVRSTTAHSLAMRAVGLDYRHRLGQPRPPSWKLAHRLDLRGGVSCRTPQGHKVLHGPQLASLALRAVTRFCATADPVPGPEHVPWQHGLDEPGSTKNNDELARVLAPYLERAWDDLSDPAGTLPFGHDHYLKVWQLGDPRIPGEFVLFDEAQDASPVMIDAVQRQDAQIVWVGDSQQQIYEWRGAVNALAHVDVTDTAYLTQSWRFGQPIAELANVILAELDAPLRLVGNPSKSSTVGPVPRPAAVLCRSNSGAMARVLQLQRAGMRVHLIGGGSEVLWFARAAGELQASGSTTHPELACFDSWEAVQAYVRDDPQGDELRLLVDLVDEYGTAIIVDALTGMPAEAAADVIVSTAHKAKGREWATVGLGGDYVDAERAGDAEWRLLYVAATRAADTLDIRFCDPLNVLRWSTPPAAAPVA